MSNVHSEKIALGMKTAAKNGTHIGRPPKFFIRSHAGTLYLRKEMRKFIRWYLQCFATRLFIIDREYLQCIIAAKCVPLGLKVTVDDLIQIIDNPRYYDRIQIGTSLSKVKNGDTLLQTLYLERLKVRAELEESLAEIQKGKEEMQEKVKSSEYISKYIQI